MARIGETSASTRSIACLDLVRHEVAAVGIGADRERLEFKIAQGTGLALADVAVEGRLVRERGAVERSCAAERRARGLERQVVDGAAVLIERLVDAGELIVDQRISGGSPLERVDALVVCFLEGFEGAHEVFKGCADVAGAGLGLELGHEIFPVLLPIASEQARRLAHVRGELHFLA